MSNYRCAVCGATRDLLRHPMNDPEKIFCVSCVKEETLLESRNSIVAIFDIDGTLADLSHRIHHIRGEQKDWEKFFESIEQDKPIYPIIGILNALCGNIGVILATGRPERLRGKTVEWMHRNSIFFDKLYMRKDGDLRSDVIVKREILDQILSDGFSPLMVFEDRTNVVKMWRDAGLQCLQVTNGDY